MALPTCSQMGTLRDYIYRSLADEAAIVTDLLPTHHFHITQTHQWFLLPMRMQSRPSSCFHHLRGAPVARSSRTFKFVYSSPGL